MNGLKYKIAKIMEGRYGVDALYYALFVLWVVLAVINIFTKNTVIYVITLLIVILMLFRSLSKNISRRRRENDIFLSIFRKIRSEAVLLKDRIKDVGKARYRKCRHCHAITRLPVKRGIHTVKCPRCGEKFDVHIII